MCQEVILNIFKFLYYFSNTLKHNNNANSTSKCNFTIFFYKSIPTTINKTIFSILYKLSL
jgi:hypothetical protein